MSFHALSRSNGSGSKPSAAPRACRLQLEHLEDRLTPNTYTVNILTDVVSTTDGRTSLREAISAANSHTGADIILLPAGILRVKLTGTTENANANGDFDITDSVTIQGAGKTATIVDGQQRDRVFDILGSSPSSTQVVFEQLTIRNGNTSGNGGGIQVSKANLTIRDSVITANRAAVTGGGISNFTSPGTGNVLLVRSSVHHNVSGGDGGGVRIAGDASLLTLNGSEIRRNDSAANGGGISASKVILTGSTVVGNTAFGGDGAGISATTATLTNSTVNANVAGGSGGGISAGMTAMTNSTISGNTAAMNGGGLAVETGATILNCTIADNMALNGGGVFRSTTATDVARVRNSIIALNLTRAGGTGPDVNGTFVTLGSNLLGDVTGSTGFDQIGDFFGTANEPLDPLIGQLAANGGPTKTHALLPGSRAIDNGSNANATPTDQRGGGYPRLKDGNGDGIPGVDIGAFEL